MLSRRQLLAAFTPALTPLLHAQGHNDPRALAALQALESRAGGRLGVCLLDTASGRLMGNRLDEHFAMCSTFKLPLAAAVLRMAERGKLRLDEAIPYSEKDMLSHAPVTRLHLAEGSMTVKALTEATQTTSDNPAANLLLRRLGGPAALTAALRSMGARATRIDRMEPERLLSFRWHPYAVDPALDYSQEPTTLVVFELKKAEGGTLLKVVESGFDAIPPARRLESDCGLVHRSLSFEVVSCRRA